MGRKRIFGEGGKLNEESAAEKKAVKLNKAGAESGTTYRVSPGYKQHFDPEKVKKFEFRTMKNTNAPKSTDFGTVGVHPDVVELCEKFHIEDVFAHELHHLMVKRQDTFVKDISWLWQNMQKAANPQKCLAAHMEVMEEEVEANAEKADKIIVAEKPRFPTNPGRVFWAKMSNADIAERKRSDAEKMDEDNWDPAFCKLITDFDLDREATQCLAKILMPFPPGRRHAYYLELRAHMEATKGRPSATAMRCLPRIKAGSSLGPPASKTGRNARLEPIIDEEEVARRRKEQSRAAFEEARRKAMVQVPIRRSKYDVEDHCSEEEDNDEAAPPSSFAAGMLAAAEKVEERREPVVDVQNFRENMDPQVKYLQTKFNLDDEAVIAVADAVGRHSEDDRQDYYIDLALHLEASKRPNGMIHRLLVTVREGEELDEEPGEDGQEDDTEIEHFQMKFGLNDEATKNLAEAMARHEPTARQAYYVNLEQFLEESECPSATIILLVAAIKKSEPLTPDVLRR